MPERVALTQIVVGRKDERTIVMPGETHDFTAADLEQLEGMDPPVIAMPRVVKRPVAPEPAEGEVGHEPSPPSPRTARRSRHEDPDEL